MNLEDIVRQRIFDRFKSLRAFTQYLDIPYSTIDSMLKKGICGTSVQTVIRVCDALDLDIEWVSDAILGKQRKETLNLEPDERQLILNYRQLSDEGKESIQKLMIMHVNTFKKSDCIPDMEASEEIA